MHRMVLPAVLVLLPAAMAAAPGPAAAALPRRCQQVARGSEIHAFVAGGPLNASADTLTISLCLVAGPGAQRIGSYQGELRFDPAAASLVSARHAPGGMRVHNEIEPGRLRFAGVAPDGIAETAVLHLVLRLPPSRRTIPPIALTIREIASTGGDDLTASVVAARPDGAPAHDESPHLPARSTGTP